MSNLVFLVLCAFLFVNVHGFSLDKVGSGESSSEEKQKKHVLESLKEFVHLVDKYKLNVTIIGSQNSYYRSDGSRKEELAVVLQMPVNNEHLTQATLDNDKQEKYLTKFEKLAVRENVGLRTRLVKVLDGNSHNEGIHGVNKAYVVQSLPYEVVVSVRNGTPGFQGSLVDGPKEQTNEWLREYIIKNPSENVKYVQVITGNVLIEDLKISEGFPEETLAEIKKQIPKLYLSIDDHELFARLLVEHLDSKFQDAHQVLIGVDKFALNGKKFANLKVADSNVIVFIL